jgi:hypothetical protein
LFTYYVIWIFKNFATSFHVPFMLFGFFICCKFFPSCYRFGGHDLLKVHFGFQYSIFICLIYVNCISLILQILVSFLLNNLVFLRFNSYNLGCKLHFFKSFSMWLTTWWPLGHIYNWKVKKCNGVKFLFKFSNFCRILN